MSGNWNGHALPSRADTAASRCGDIIDRGMAKFGLDKAQPRFVPLARKREQKVMPPLTEQERLARNAAVIADWRATPAGKRVMNTFVVRYRLSHATLRRVLAEAGFKMPAPNSRNGESRAFAEKRAARVVAAWDAMKEEERSITSVARVARVGGGTAKDALLAAGRISVNTPSRRGKVRPRLTDEQEAA